jgi:hypothetical protein
MDRIPLIHNHQIVERTLGGPKYKQRVIKNRNESLMGTRNTSGPYGP